MASQTTPSRTTVDGFIKVALRRFYRELGELVVGEKPDSVEALETAQAALAQRFADKLLGLRFRRRPPILLHVEFQTEGDPSMPRRMAQYASLIFASATHKCGEAWVPASAVVYLDPKAYRHDRGRFELRGELGFQMLVRYKVIKLWELPRERILSMRSPGLCPFVPLLAGNPEEGLLQSTAKIVRSRVPAETKRELLALTAGLAGVVIRNHDLIHQVLSEIRLMGKNYVFDILREEGEAVGLVKGKAEGIRLSLLRILRQRFSTVPASIQSAIGRVHGAAELERLLDVAAVAPSLKAFGRALPVKPR